MNPHSTYTSADGRWRAIIARDPRADGRFVYAVKTTGIFCRPSCSSKLPKRENVEYFGSGEEALAAGYRPCKKCRPTGKTVKEEIEHKVVQACRIIERSRTIPQLPDLAKEVGLSPFHFHRLFKQVVGVTPKQFATHHRAKRFRTSLQSSNSITEALFDAGYSSSSGAYNRSQDRLSMQPKEYRAGGQGIDIRYGIAECPLGWVIVAATDRGICAIEFGDDPEKLPELMHSRFPQAAVSAAGPGFTRLIEEVVHFINTPWSNFTLPLDIQGTAFQQQVWDILRQIEPGETMSYTEVAEKIGNPKAVRAVAAACGQNTLAVVIPCHRVITKDGRVSGYRWGVERKKMLLENEKKQK